MIKEVLEKQYKKSLNIFKDIIIKYDDDIWNNEVDYKSPAWQIAYHAIFYTNIYCSASENEIQKWGKERHEYNNHKKMNEIRQNKNEIIIPYTKIDIIDYIEFLELNVPIYLEQMEPERKCWPYWYDENQLEFHLNNLRHLQHHIGEILERHDIRKNIEYIWQ